MIVQALLGHAPNGTPEDIQTFVHLLKLTGFKVSVTGHTNQGANILQIEGDVAEIKKRLTTKTGRPPKHTDLLIQDVLDALPPPYRNGYRKCKELERLNLSERTYYRTKHAIEAVYDTLENAIKQGYIYFVDPHSSAAHSLPKVIAE